MQFFSCNPGLSLFTADCEAGWTRFGSHCYKALGRARATAVQDRCMDLGASMFFPESREEFYWLAAVYKDKVRGLEWTFTLLVKVEMEIVSFVFYLIKLRI